MTHQPVQGQGWERVGERRKLSELREWHKQRPCLGNTESIPGCWGPPEQVAACCTERGGRWEGATGQAGVRPYPWGWCCQMFWWWGLCPGALRLVLAAPERLEAGSAAADTVKGLRLGTTDRNIKQGSRRPPAHIPSVQHRGGQPPGAAGRRTCDRGP